MLNPMHALRIDKTWTLYDASIVLGVSYQVTHRVEEGYSVKVPKSVIAGLKALGVDADKFYDDYAAWRSELRQSLLDDPPLRWGTPGPRNSLR